MKKIFRLSVSAIFAAALATMTVSCGTEELDTAQYSDNQVRLVSYGPNPVMRGGALTFIGSNLDKIVEVDVPGVSPITDIEVVSSGLQSEIRVILPVEGPEVGTVTLRSSEGKTFTTKTELEYTEPIVLESFSTKETPAYPGDVVALKGDYMNLVKSVTFEGGESVAVENIDRHNATVVIPATAITGKIILSDEGEIANLIYSENDLQIGDPTVTSVKADAWKPGKTATISGEHLEMVKEITLAGDVTVETEAIKLAEDGKSVAFEIPATAQSGDVNAVSYAGKSFKAGTVAMVVPTGLKAPSAPVKAGKEIEIAGKDLDVVSAVSFPGADAESFTVNEAGTSLKVTVPVTATEGEISLKMANGDVVTVAYSLVKAVVASVSPVELMAGETITVKGADLDLVSAATLGGKDVEFKVNGDGTELTLTTAKTSVSGKIVLTQQNGVTIEPSDEIKLTYDSFIIVNSMPSQAHIGELVTLKGENFLMIENIYIGDAKVTSYGTRTDNEISFIMPFNKIGTYPMVFNLLSGASETCPNQIEVLLEINYITAWEGNLTITWGDGGRVIVPASKFDGVTAGTKMRFHYIYDDDVWCQAQINYGDWGGLVFSEIGSNTLVPACSWSGKGKVEAFTEVTLTADILSAIEAKKGDCENVKAAGIIIQGSDVTFTKVEIIQEIPQEKTIWSGSFNCGSWSGNQDLAWGGFDWSTIQAGQKLIFTLTQDSSQTWWQLSLRHGDSWGELPEKVFVEMTEGQTRVEVVMTQTNLDDLKAHNGLVITGCNYTLTQIAVL
jgi:hypothetical protein